MRRDLWRILLRWAIVTAVVFLIYVGSARWGGDPYATRLLASCATLCVVVGLPVALLVSLVHRRKARRVMAEWERYRREGEPKDRGSVLHAA